MNYLNDELIIHCPVIHDFGVAIEYSIFIIQRRQWLKLLKTIKHNLAIYLNKSLQEAYEYEIPFYIKINNKGESASEYEGLITLESIITNCKIIETNPDQKLIDIIKKIENKSIYEQLKKFNKSLLHFIKYPDQINKYKLLFYGNIYFYPID